MRSSIKYFIFLTVILVSIEVTGQKKKFKAPKDPQKEAVKKQEAEEKKLERDIKKLKKEHRKLQGKKASRRMKNNKKRSTRHAQNRKDPFLQRVFRKKNDKKVKEKG
ncbi:MAG: hypothetical protein HKN45_09090 [Flavobacteriales bacterium]|nr:hypothetical protein [Flavobacteriales bacterium]